MPMSSHTDKPKVARHVVRHIAVESYTDERSVANYLEGRALRPMTLARIEGAVRRLGLDELLRSVAT